MTMYKTIPLEKVMEALPAKRREAIEAKGRELLERIDRRVNVAESDRTGQQRAEETWQSN